MMFYQLIVVLGAGIDTPLAAVVYPPSERPECIERVQGPAQVRGRVIFDNCLDAGALAVVLNEFRCSQGRAVVGEDGVVYMPCTRVPG